MLSIENNPDVFFSTDAIKPHMPERTTETLKEKLRTAMEAKRYNGRMLSLGAGVDPSYISKLLRGEIRNPSYEVLGRIAATLGVTVEWFHGKEVTVPAGTLDIDHELFVQVVELADSRIKAGEYDLTPKQYANYLWDMYQMALQIKRNNNSTPS